MHFNCNPQLIGVYYFNAIQQVRIHVYVSGDVAVRPVKPSGADAAVDDTVFTRASPQLALLPRYPVYVRASDTATGVTSHQLVLNSDVLTPGSAYFVRVSVFHKRMLLLCNAIFNCFQCSYW